MSEFHVVVVEIGKVEKHPNADSLSITQVHGGYPCIFRTGEFQSGDKVVYCPIDSLVPLDAERWSFLRPTGRLYDPGTYARIKAKKLRGIFSMGILTQADPSWQLGQNVQELIGIKKWEQPVSLGHMMNTESEQDPGFLPEYTSIEGLRKHGNILIPGEEVAITEKIHGMSWRGIYRDGRLWVGSHRIIRKEDYRNVFWRAAKQYDLATKFQAYPHIAFYGEVYGPGIQDLHYGIPAQEVRLSLFDAYDVDARQYLDFEQFVKVTNDLELPIPPILYRGLWSESCRAVCEGPSRVGGANHLLEGGVIKPTHERWDSTIGRVVLKLVSEAFLLRKGG